MNHPYYDHQKWKQQLNDLNQQVQEEKDALWEYNQMPTLKQRALKRVIQQQLQREQYDLKFVALKQQMTKETNQDKVKKLINKLTD